jgi:hypothetical protein
MSRAKKSDGWPDAFKEVGLAIVNHGQAPLCMLLGGLLIVLWRMPEEDLSAVCTDMLAMLKAGWYWGWFLTPVALIGWYVDRTNGRRLHGAEMARVGSEKSWAQQEAAGNERRDIIKSSEKK